MRKLKQLILTFATGFVGGYLTCICITKYLSRPRNPGGEILVIPLILVLLCLIEELKGGFENAKAINYENEAKQHGETL